MSVPDPNRKADLIILGGGCAGLSLATNLAIARTALNVVVVEPRTAYHEDRTWCGWRIAPHSFEDCAIARWDRWQVATPAGVIERSSNLYPYEMIRSDLFYEKACRAIARHASMCLLQGLSADHLSETASHVEVVLSDGSTLSAPWVIDTRPAQPAITRPWLWQNFVGFVIELDASKPEHRTSAKRFGQIPLLMDFQAPGGCIAQFMYLLPFGDREFLCEWTQFASAPGQFAEIESSLRHWLQAHAGSGWIIHRREQGTLPMTLAPTTPTGRIVPAGTRGGSMRASTGYAFHAIQRWAAACSASLQTTGTPLAPQRNRLLENMDAIFLEVLHQPSTSAMEIFRSLFKNSPPDSLVRFLAGTPRGSDLWPIMRGLPWGSFLRAAPAALRSNRQSFGDHLPIPQPDAGKHSRSRT